VCIAVAALAGAAAAGWWALQQGRAPIRAPGGTVDPDVPAAPARTRSAIEPWMAITAALLIAGIVIAPRLLGVTFLFLPLMFGRRRRGPRGPRSNDWGRGRDDPDGPGAI
jgi:hypothetical protein